MDPLLNPTTRPPDCRTLCFPARTTVSQIVKTVVRGPAAPPPQCRKGPLTWGAPEEIRTPNLLIRSQMLYPLSYGRLSSIVSGGERI
jgi:hypothetical protein